MNIEEAKQAAQDAFEQLAAELEQGQSETLKAYLAAMGRFWRYSLRNAMLITRPNGLVPNMWQDSKHGRSWGGTYEKVNMGSRFSHRSCGDGAKDKNQTDDDAPESGEESLDDTQKNDDRISSVRTSSTSARQMAGSCLNLLAPVVIQVTIQSGSKRSLPSKALSWITQRGSVLPGVCRVAAESRYCLVCCRQRSSRCSHMSSPMK